MTKVYCFLNGPYLGGAERSFVLQASHLKESNENLKFEFFIPHFGNLNEVGDLKNFILAQGFRDTQIRYYHYSPTLYKLSRSSGLRSILPWFFKVTFGLLQTISRLSRLELQSPDVWWVGGNKVGFVVFILGFLSSFKGRLLWHFRDYPYDEGIYFLIWRLFRLPHQFTFEAIATSHSVANELQRFKRYFSKIHVLYNPVGKITFHSNAEKVRLGTASMMAPWKGVQPLIVFALLYEKELRSIGIDEFEVYGDEIYKTDGGHLGYMSALKKLSKLSKSNFISFKGLRPPNEIFKDLDIFIHGALKPEPFGRVVVEAYRGGAALLSTGLGGSDELIEDEKTGYIFRPYDYHGLFQYVRRLCGDERFSLIENARHKADEIDRKYREQLKAIF